MIESKVIFERREERQIVSQSSEVWRCPSARNFIYFDEKFISQRFLFNQLQLVLKTTTVVLLLRKRSYLFLTCGYNFLWCGILKCRDRINFISSQVLLLSLLNRFTMLVILFQQVSNICKFLIKCLTGI